MFRRNHPGERDAAAVWLAALRAGAPVGDRAVVVAAHPDDETLGLGLRLAELEDCLLLHLTDGAPDDPRRAVRAGFADPARYAAARRRELDAALAQLGATPRREARGLSDQGVVFRTWELAQLLAERLAGATFVVTHAFEGGHPDHDAAALAVQLACEQLRARGEPAPARLEFAGYHLGPAGRVAGAFWPDPSRPAVRPDPRPDRLAAKRAALGCFGSQAAVLAWFDSAREAYRAAPDYDFTAPPPPGASLYDGFGWAITSELWREAARAVLARQAEAAA